MHTAVKKSINLIEVVLKSRTSQYVHDVIAPQSKSQRRHSVLVSYSDTLESYQFQLA